MAIRGVSIGGVSAFVAINREVIAKLPGLRPRFGPAKARPPAPARPVHDSTHTDMHQRIADTEWYHSIDLGQYGVTLGAFDHRPVLAEYRLPDRLDGLRVLDVATYDGFWAFEMEKRGAREVIAVDLNSYRDLDYPSAVRAKLTTEQLDRKTGAGFALAHELKRSNVRREVLSVYDLSPERLGMFDVVFCSDLLLHLKSPMKALESMRSVTSGYLHLCETVSPLSAPIIEYRGGADLCVWWFFSSGALEAMVADAGFSRIDVLNRFQIGHRGEKPTMWHVALKATV